QQLRAARHRQGVPRQRLPYINLEDDRLAGLTERELSWLIEEYYRLFPSFRRNQTVTWCFDEVQVVPGWERFVRRLLDTEKVEILVSGSSAALLSREVATAMRGRAWEVALFPFSFEEFLRHRHQVFPDRLELLEPALRSSLESAFREYLTVGGFPEVQGLAVADRRRVLRDYVDVAILRDVVERHRVSNVVSLRWLVRHLLANPASPFSVEKFHNVLKSQGIGVGRDTLHHFLAYLEDCFLVRVGWLATDSERRRMVNPRKVYPVDPGLIPLFDRSGKANIGHALETAVRIELERRDAEVHYVRTRDGYEVDFLARYADGQQELIQVCVALDDLNTREREMRALEAAAREFPRASLLLITLAPETAHDVPEHIRVHNAPFWFLAPWLQKPHLDQEPPADE
ncbi:MAG: ATP-binding protein, partial [Planctomycetes bacterium]|nr:ATP-binding protein [Planctomycetota bacterium]